MFIRWALLFAVVTPLLCNCAKEDKPKSPVVRVELKGSCDLKNIGDDLVKFTKGEMSSERIADVWVCTENAVSDFDRITRGDLPGGDYSPQAVRKFFEKYFLSNRTVDDKLLASIMRLKQVLVSGGTDRITRRELNRLQDLLGLVRELSVAMNPYAKVIFLSADSASDEQILSANQAFDISIRRLGEWLGVQGQSYSFAEAKDLILNLRDWLRNKGTQPEVLNDFEKIFDVVPALKQILLSGQVDGLSGADWVPLTQALGQAHCALLAIKYSFKENLVAGLNRGAIPQGIEKFIDVLDDARRLHPNQEIPLSEWSEFFKTVEATGWLGKDFTAKNLDKALSWAVNRLLNGTAGATQTAIKEVHLRTLRKNLEHWMDLRNLVLTEQSDPAAGIETQFVELLQASVPAEWDAKGRQVFSIQAPQVWSKDAKMNMIWPFVIINWVKESFVGEDPVTMNDADMLQAGQEVLTVLQSFGWMKDTKKTIGQRLLREADLFTAASNGDSLLDVKEATRYLAFVASAFRAAQEWIEQTNSICPDDQAVCLRQAAVDPRLDVLSPLPRLRLGFTKDLVKEFSAYAKAAEETCLGQPIAESATTGDLLQEWMIFQYVETFERRFDEDRNDILNLTEGKAAFQLFGGPLGKMVEPIGLPTDEVLGFFTFLLKYGDTPFTMLGGQIAYNHWKWHENDWALETDRKKLVEVLKQLSKL